MIGLKMNRKWFHHKTEQLNNGYTFSGKLYVTKIIKEKVPTPELQQILNDIWGRVQEEGGIDYLQIYKSREGKTIFVIDNINQEMRKEKPEEWIEANDYFTVMFSCEY